MFFPSTPLLLNLTNFTHTRKKIAALPAPILIKIGIESTVKCVDLLDRISPKSDTGLISTDRNPLSSRRK